MVSSERLEASNRQRSGRTRNRQADEQTGRIWVVVGRSVVSEHECGGLYGRRGRRRVHDADKTQPRTDGTIREGRGQSAQRRGGCAVVVCCAVQWRAKPVLVRAGTRRRNRECRDTRGGRPSRRAGRQSQRNAKTTDAFSFAGVEGGWPARRDSLEARGNEGGRG
jgi:hypothetical protein